MFVGYRDRLDTGVEAVEARRERYEQVFADLDAAGVARDDLFLAWDFTVASVRNLTERMLHIRDDAFAQLGDAAPAFTVDTVEESPEPNLLRRVTGTVQVPLYLTGAGEPGSRFVGADGDNLPSQNGTATYPAAFRCIIPNAAQNAARARSRCTATGSSEAIAKSMAAMSAPWPTSTTSCSARHRGSGCRKKTSRTRSQP